MLFELLFIVFFFLERGVLSINKRDSVANVYLQIVSLVFVIVLVVCDIWCVSVGKSVCYDFKFDSAQLSKTFFCLFLLLFFGIFFSRCDVVSSFCFAFLHVLVGWYDGGFWHVVVQWFFLLWIFLLCKTFSKF